MNFVKLLEYVVRSCMQLNPIEIGKFICELRKSRNWSQNDLANMLNISRQAISKWENGINIPDSSTLILLAKIFEVSTDELLLGKKLDKKERTEEISSLTLTMLDQSNKKSESIKRLKMIFLIFTLVAINLFLLYYLFHSYNSIKVYTMSGSSEHFSTKNGIFVVTNEKSYFRLGTLEYDKDIIIEEYKMLKHFA